MITDATKQKLPHNLCPGANTSKQSILHYVSVPSGELPAEDSYNRPRADYAC